MPSSTETYSITQQRHDCYCINVTHSPAQIWDFLHTLEADLSAGVGGRLDSVLSQCMYFGLSFSRIGADFRPILLPIVHRAVLESFKKTIRRAKVE